MAFRKQNKILHRLRVISNTICKFVIIVVNHGPLKGELLWWTNAPPNRQGWIGPGGYRLSLIAV